MGENSSESLQSKCKSRLEALMPEILVRVSGDALLFNKKLLTSSDLNYISMIEGMYKDINVKRSGRGVVVVLMF